ncbi:hypothetical protein [Anaerococcus hydrogenalis]|uniref:Phage transcriptional regulator, RinA family n=1 Tax=Anaerococcus hydrogenalis ACS-025-V-Sch4 TaxID=879306 RepID=F0H1P8_9FIRM|nr:hypothetical protein [Anaerococcus hydrogenalis]EGC83681.1 hypothetical protein HMPREF9246_1252 [Anaerococcus hydrogenalis ACS-025-V-Sch4]
MQSFYVNLVKEKLKRYFYARDFISRAERKIDELNSLKEGKIVVFYGDKPPFGGFEDKDKLLNILAEIDLLETNIRENKKIIEELDYAFKSMSEIQRDITLEIYGRPYKYNKIQNLKDKYHYEKAHLYNLANEGLVHIALSLFGKY